MDRKQEGNNQEADDGEKEKSKNVGIEKIYAVAAGRNPGIYHDFADAKNQVDGYSGHNFKRVPSVTEGKKYNEKHNETVKNVEAKERKGTPIKLEKAEEMLSSPEFHAVAFGRERGIFPSWAEAGPYVDGFGDKRHKKFTTEQEAKDYMKAEEDKVYRNPHYEVLNQGKLLIIFCRDGSNKCYEFDWESGGKYYCRGCKNSKPKYNVSARIHTECGEYVRPGINLHKCQPVDATKYKNAAGNDTKYDAKNQL